MKEWSRSIVESSWFNRFIISVIVLAGVLVGVETYEPIAEKYGVLLGILDGVVLAIFVTEIVLKLVALSPKPLLFFKDPWNVFDFLIVAVCLVPASGGLGPVIRLFRLLRVLRLLSAVPKLQLLVSALLKSVPSMGYVSILLSLLFYVYGVAGVMFFGKNDPVHFGNLGDSILTLFRVVTLEDWTDIMYIQIHGSDHYAGYNLSDAKLADYVLEPKAMPVLSIAFFVSFVLLGTMVMLNLVIGVIINGMDDARVEAEIERLKAAQNELGGENEFRVENQVKLLGAQVKEMRDAVERIGKVLEQSDSK